VKDINAAGGIAGKPLVVTFYDSGTDAAKAHVEMAKLLDTKPLAIAGMMGPDGTRGSMDLFLTEKLPALQVGSGTDVTAESYPWSISACIDEQLFCSLPEPRWIAREPDIKTVVPIYDSTIAYYAWCTGHRERALKELGITILEPVTFEQFTTVDFGPAAIAALDQNADGYIFACAGDPIAKTIIEMHMRGMTMEDNRRILVSTCGDYAELYDVGAGYIDGIYVGSTINPAVESERWQRMKEDYEAYANVSLGLACMFGYDIPFFFKTAVEATRITGDPAKLAEERVILRDWMCNCEGIPSIMAEYDVRDCMSQAAMYLCQVQNNEKALLEVIHVSPEDNPPRVGPKLGEEGFGY